MIRLKVEASDDNLAVVVNSILKELEANGCPQKIRKQIKLAVEEVFVNICSYAYESGSGMIETETEILRDTSSKIIIRITDTGIPFDPLTGEDPDISLPIGRRPIGGLGIFMFKQIMDETVYEYKDGKNCLTMIKRFETEPYTDHIQEQISHA